MMKPREVGGRIKEAKAAAAEVFRIHPSYNWDLALRRLPFKNRADYVAGDSAYN